MLLDEGVLLVSDLPAKPEPFLPPGHDPGL